MEGAPRAEDEIFRVHFVANVRTERFPARSEFSLYIAPCFPPGSKVRRLARRFYLHEYNESHPLPTAIVPAMFIADVLKSNKLSL